METPLEKFLRKVNTLALSNVGSYSRRTKAGKLVHVSAHHRNDPEGIADELSQNSGNLNDQQLNLTLDYLRVNYDKLRADQQKAAQRLIDHLQQVKQARAASNETLKYSINPLRVDDVKLNWDKYRNRLRDIRG